MTENFYFLFHYLKKEKITIDPNEFVFQLNSHPDAPSLLAISDTLSFFNIDNLATKINFEDVIHLPKNFIALLKKDTNQPFLTLVEKTNNGYKYQDEKKQIIITESEFENVFQNIVLLAEKEDINLNKNISSSSNQFYLLLAVTVFYISFLFISKATFNVYLFSILASSGIYLSLAAIFKELGIESKLSNTVCNITSSTDCDKVIKTKGVGILEKFNYTNFSITFFITQLVLLFITQLANITNTFFEFQFILLLCSIPITFLSIYHQNKIAKKWCPICLMIIGLLYAEIGVIYFTYSILFQFDILIIVVFLIFFIITYFIASTMKNVFKMKNEQQEELLAVNRFKRNYNLFKLALNESDKVNIELNTNSLLVGNPNANLKITLVTNPFCGFCKEAHQIIEKIYKSHKDNICIIFQFNYNVEREDVKSKEVHNQFIQICFNEGQDSFMNALHNWFENSISPIAKSNTINELKINEILNQHYMSNQDNNINFTPCLIINDVVFPKMYERKDLVYFIPEILSELENN